MRQETQIKALQVVILHLGDSLTFAEIGRCMGFSRQRAHQLYKKCNADMRHKEWHEMLIKLLNTMSSDTYHDIESVLIEFQIWKARRKLDSLTGKDT